MESEGGLGYLILIKTIERKLKMPTPKNKKSSEKNLRGVGQEKVKIRAKNLDIDFYKECEGFIFERVDLILKSVIKNLWWS